MKNISLAIPGFRVNDQGKRKEILSGHQIFRRPEIARRHVRITAVITRDVARGDFVVVGTAVVGTVVSSVVGGGIVTSGVTGVTSGTTSL